MKKVEAPAGTPRTVEPPPAPISLITLPGSPYAATLAIDGSAILLVMKDGVHRLVPGEPPTRLPLELGPNVTVTDSFYLFWTEGAMRRVPKSGGPRRALFEMAREPVYLAASRGELAWVGRGEHGEYTLETPGDRKPLRLYDTRSSIDALTLVGSWVFFVERATEGAWRVGRLPLSGGAPSFGPLHRGRAPAMLATSEDELYYYDGNAREVRRLSPDFQREEVIAEQFICSPIAVAKFVYCGQVEGLFELRQGAAPRKLAPATGAVAGIVADATRIAWMSEAGSNALSVQLLTTQ